MFTLSKRCLLIGAGSGRDILATTLLSERPDFASVQFDVAGFLTPWAVHKFSKRTERPINKLGKGVSTKNLYNKGSEKVASYFECDLLNLRDAFNLNHRNYYLFSLHSGLPRLRRDFQTLINKNRYDVIVLIDVGGDILTSYESLPQVYTPIVDLTSLELLKSSRTRARKIVAVVAPGSDGELSAVSIRKEISSLRKSKGMISHEIIDSGSIYFSQFIALSNEVDKRTGLKGGTVRTIKLGLNKESIQTIRLKKSASVFGKEVMWGFEHKINHDLLKQILYFDPKTIYKHTYSIPMFKNVLDAHLSLRPECSGTELDLSYIPTTFGTRHLSNIYSLTPNEKMKARDRTILLQYGLDNYRAYVSQLLVLQRDLKYVKVPREAVIQKLSPRWSILNSRR
jgi:hypothetical protein